MAGRKELPQEEKKKPIVIFVKQKAITQLGEENIKQECAKTIEKMLNNLK